MEKKQNKLIKIQGAEVYIRNNTSLDRYGFSYLLADRLKLKEPLRPFCNWSHGWYFWNDIMKIEDLIGMKGCPIDTSIIVGSKSEYVKFVEAGYKNVNIGGLPFAYVSEQGIQRNSNAMLAFIGHSSESEKINIIDLEYLNYLESQKVNFEEIYVSIYSLDKDTKIIEEVVKRGLIPSNGANPFDKRSLIRTRIALEYCEHISTNTFGSHIAYALAAGCRVSVFSPCIKYDTSKYKENQNYSNDYIERIEYYTSESYLRNRWDYLFDKNSSDGYQNKKIGLEWIGEEYRLSNEQLRRVLCWDFSGQIKGYMSGAIRRANAKIKIK